MSRISSEEELKNKKKDENHKQTSNGQKLCLEDRKTDALMKGAISIGKVQKYSNDNSEGQESKKQTKLPPVNLNVPLPLNPNYNQPSLQSLKADESSVIQVSTHSSFSEALGTFEPQVCSSTFESEVLTKLRNIEYDRLAANEDRKQMKEMHGDIIKIMKKQSEMMETHNDLMRTQNNLLNNVRDHETRIKRLELGRNREPHPGGLSSKYIGLKSTGAPQYQQQNMFRSNYDRTLYDLAYGMFIYKGTLGNRE